MLFRSHSARIVRAIKNRFGTTQELGIFEMTGQGLQQLPGGMSVAAIQSGDEHRPGAIVCPAMHGSRCVCVEIQALTATGFVGSAKRKSSGLDSSRLAMLIAVLEQHGGLRLADRDVFTSVVGGLKIVEPAADLALALRSQARTTNARSPPRRSRSAKSDSAANCAQRPRSNSDSVNPHGLGTTRDRAEFGFIETAEGERDGVERGEKCVAGD